jgi:phosphotriesterase-related protein
MPVLHTTLGPKSAEDLGLILPHEHVFVDLRTPDRPGYAEADADEVVRVMTPQIEAAKAQGVTALVECTTGGVGRRADFDLAVSQATGFPIVVPTGNYREPWIPEWVARASEAELEAWMTRELEVRLDEAPFKAGWIKLSAGDDGITELEARILRAAARAARRCNATIGSHTIKGRVVMDQLDIIEAEGHDPARFISIHTQAEPDFDLHKAVAARGAWLEYDNAGWVPDGEFVDVAMRALDAGLEKQMLLSHDAGWYDPAKPAGGEQKPYTVLTGSILPALREKGVSEETIRLLTHTNPFNAFAR